MNENSKERLRWYVCQRCGKRLFPVTKHTKIANLTFKCRGCGTLIEINL